MSEVSIEKKLKHYRLSKDEFELIRQKLGREPRGVEWALFSALWSEHCSYKSSRVHLKKLFNKSSRVVMSFGENAGVIDLGEGERIAFKMESHNHPSFIEPYEGAATGVGGILRDIFTMGARPIALANYLCFGEPKASRMTSLVDGVVRGIGGYGNCVGVPTITGQTEFHSSYNKNILVNALALGLFVEGEPILSSKAKGVGNLVVYVGAKTGKDGVHGASMASEAFDVNNEAKKPTIQKGDPFYEKLLIESCIEVMQANLVEAIQDMGAAGLTSSSFEMAAKGGVGFKIHLDRVPLRDLSMNPEEILLSESQERMLLVCRPENFEKLKVVFSKWNLDAEVIGEVTSSKDVQLYWHGECICAMDPTILVDEAPLYNRPYREWQAKNKVKETDFLPLAPQSAAQTLLDILADVRGNSRRWIYEQYDQRVGAKTVFDCSESVGLVRLPSGRGLGLVLGARPHVIRVDAQLGGVDSVIYPALELASKGLLPLATTDCLNFGNPENFEIMTEFVAAVEGMSKACAALETPIISGNVSFYNETLGENITSTPATGIVGIRDTVENVPPSQFQEKNSELFLLQLPAVKLRGLLAEMKQQSPMWSGGIDIEQMAKLIHVIRHMALAPGVLSTRVVGKFGLAYTLARMCTDALGVDVQSKDCGDLFTERLYEVVFEVAAADAFSFKELFARLSAQLNFNLVQLGQTRENKFVIQNQIDLKLTDIQETYYKNWEACFAGLS